jgi:hypothetical protein
MRPARGPPGTGAPPIGGPNGPDAPSRWSRQGWRGGRSRFSRSETAIGGRASRARPLWPGWRRAARAWIARPRAREHTHQGAGRSPRRAAYLRWFCGAPVRRRTRRAARGARCPASGVPTPVRNIGRRHAPRTASRSSTRARVHPREDAPNRNRAVAKASARVAVTSKAQPVAQTPAARIRRGPADAQRTAAARSGRSFGPQAVARRSDARRSDSRPQALAPGPGPST